MKVKFVPQDIEFEIRPGQSVLQLAQENGVFIKSVCKGVPSCAECRVRVIEGDHNVLQPAAEELSLIGTGHFIDRRRLSCQLKCFGDITVDLSEQIEKQKSLTELEKSSGYIGLNDRVEEQSVIRSEEGSDSLDSFRSSASDLSENEEGSASSVEGRSDDSNADQNSSEAKRMHRDRSGSPVEGNRRSPVNEPHRGGSNRDRNRNRRQGSSPQQKGHPQSGHQRPMNQGGGGEKGPSDAQNKTSMSSTNSPRPGGGQPGGQNKNAPARNKGRKNRHQRHHNSPRGSK